MTRLAALVALCLTGCVSSEARVLHLRYDNSSGAAVNLPAAPSCRIAVGSINDERSNRESVGAPGNQPLSMDSLNNWIAQGMTSMRQLGYELTPFGAAEGAAADIVADIGIRRVYVRTAVSQFEAVVELRARVRGRRGRVTEGHYRGSATKVNWVNGVGEVSTVLNRALSAAVRRLSEDIRARCSE